MIKRKAVAAKKSTASSGPGGAVIGSEARRAGLGEVDLETVRELARIATEFDLSEVEADPSGRIRVARRTELPLGAIAPVAMAHPGALSLMPSGAADKGQDRAQDRGEDKAAAAITSPFVGTFYRSPSPDAASFVEAGQTVRKGQVVCIVEAMKLMNEIESDFDGKILDILVKNGEHVEYGQPLFRLEKP
jgi:acetyl-CoA carboxylase biotin carboxyl carrier protein